MQKKKVPFKSEKLGQAVSVGCIFNNTKFYGLAKLIPELCILTFLLIIITGLFNICNILELNINKDGKRNERAATVTRIHCKIGSNQLKFKSKLLLGEKYFLEVRTRL